MLPISEVPFRKDFVNHFPGEESGQIHSRQTPGVLYSKAPPTPVADPKLIAWTQELGEELGIAAPQQQKDIDLLAGNYLNPTQYPYAACYAGHQFGQWAGQLGDGRAITAGEVISTTGMSWELQWKGAGRTAYSRRADGRAVLRSSVREYLMSEAMFHLGVPTTRALSLVTTGEPVLRDAFYDGHPAYEPGAIVLRAAPSFLRFGSFEMPASRNELQHLRKLVDWTIEKHFPTIKEAEPLLPWFREVVNRTAFLITEWMRVGFVHGVMNTDNMSILGLTIDYGPYSMLDAYDPGFTPNTTDLPGKRYAFGKQAAVAKWNLGCLAGALAPLIKDTAPLIAVLDEYDILFWEHYFHMMSRKLGLDTVRPDDQELINKLVQVLTQVKPDMTLFFRLLMTYERTNEVDTILHFNEAFYRPLDQDEAQQFNDWIVSYCHRMECNQISPKERWERMNGANPYFLLRNYLLQQAHEQLEAGDASLFHTLHKALKEPYADTFHQFFARRPDWAQDKAGCSMLSCSS
ncbi:MAG TPA: YdiU family protein [Flavisolibacter sp.]|nr:YdiU family protein [Flavisolibacter sp.]